MRAERAITALQSLRADPFHIFYEEQSFVSWIEKVRGVLVSAFGREDHLVERFDGVQFDAARHRHEPSLLERNEARTAGIEHAMGVIDAALFHLKLRVADTDEPVDSRAFDPDLWEHVKHLVEDEDWGKVASQTCIFLEDRLRNWGNDPADTKGDGLVGKGLMGSIFNDTSELRLGSRKAEWEGWRSFAVGFAQALSNVDRHRIQKRDDARRYSIGVLGAASLILTQVRFEHGDLIEDYETGVLAQSAE